RADGPAREQASEGSRCRYRETRRASAAVLCGGTVAEGQALVEGRSKRRRRVAVSSLAAF
ncbi:MAG: hypothetical protein WD733_03615, partial [Bryobacterales bacterium]